MAGERHRSRLRSVPRRLRAALLRAEPAGGDHVGKQAAIEVLVEATQRSGRQLDAIEDILGGATFAALVVREGVGRDAQRVIRRVFVYAVRDGKLAECWLYDEGQRFVDSLWSTPTPGE